MCNPLTYLQQSHAPVRPQGLAEGRWTAVDGGVHFNVWSARLTTSGRV